MLAFAEWQVVEDGSDETMRNVEIRGTVFALSGAEPL
jgi:hypothetical protein